MSNWNIAEAIYLLGQSDAGERTALIHDDTVFSYAELSRRAMAIASWLDTLDLPAGLRRQLHALVRVKDVRRRQWLRATLLPRGRLPARHLSAVRGPQRLWECLLPGRLHKR